MPVGPVMPPGYFTVGASHPSSIRCFKQPDHPALMRELGLGCRCANHWPLTESPSLGPDLDRGTCTEDSPRTGKDIRVQFTGKLFKCLGPVGNAQPA